jgi:alkaline phosphatase/streptomycin-6-phosphatase
LGLFNDEDITTNWSGPATALGKGNVPVACTEGQRPAIEPSLAAMSRRALKLLDNDTGFFLQIEGGLIDKEAHLANPCGQIGETIAFDQAVGVALNFQRSHPGTLVIATADHSQSGMIVREDATGGGLPTGYSANLLTRDGQVLALTYGTTGYGGGRLSPPKAPIQYHSGSAVPVWAVGPGASRVLGTNDHTELFDVMRGRP